MGHIEVLDMRLEEYFEKDGERCLSNLCYYSNEVPFYFHFGLSLYHSIIAFYCVC